MQLKQLKIDHWYQTSKGIAKCLKIKLMEALFQDAHGHDPFWLSPKEVQYEVHKDSVPHSLPIESTMSAERSEDAQTSLAESKAKGGDALPLLRAAMHALRSYQFGNGSPVLAEEVADALDVFIAKGPS